MSEGQVKYAEMQKQLYEAQAQFMRYGNHLSHNNNPNYWSILLGDVFKHPESWVGKTALDFGCGCGRNVLNLFRIAGWGCVDGCDISQKNTEYAAEYVQTAGYFSSNWYATDGITLQPVPSEKYDFVMSTIVLQHIPVYSTRFSLLSDIYRVLKPGGLFSFQMGFGSCKIPTSNYYADMTDVTSTNGDADVSVLDPQTIVSDLEKIGYHDVSYTVTSSFEDSHEAWIFVRCRK